MKEDMTLKEIQELIRFLNKSNISEITIEREQFKITLKTHDSRVPQQVIPQIVTPIAQPVIQAPLQQPAAPPPVTSVTEAPKSEPPASSEAADSSRYITIKSPMIGTFYRTPSPDKPPFVNVGDEIQQGSVLCVIEAMKLFNEIESEHSGRIVKILVENARPVEYDQPLFLIEPI